MSTHNWKCEGLKWTCTTCGHSFKWGANKGMPQQFEPDGSPARADPTWFEFHIVGVLSFTDVGKGKSEEMRRRFVAMVGMDPKEQGIHAAAFEHCLLEQEIDNYAFVDQVMEE